MERTYGANVRRTENGYRGYVGVWLGIERMEQHECGSVHHSIVDAWQDANALRARLIHEATKVRIAVIAG